ncbi:MAG: F0F1 ATP synthase subunit delta [Candidatus Andersenbacteria bacterium]
MNLPVSTIVEAWITAVAPKELALALEQLELLAKAFASDRSIRSGLTAPTQDTAAKKILLKKAGFSQSVQELVGFIDKNRLWKQLDQVVLAAERLISTRLGTAKATVRSAIALTPTQSTALKSALKKQTGRDVQLTELVDAGVLGGFILDSQGRRQDFSLRGKLQRLNAAVSALTR